ncbi:hypothetical protein ACS0TY_030617 [Phlomoides rotata]
MREHDPLYEMRSMIGHILRSPAPLPPVSFDSTPPAAFGLLFIGISMALMLFGILTFFIGFVLMPLVFVLLLLFYFVRIVSKLWEIVRTILCPSSTACCNKYGITQAEVS